MWSIAGLRPAMLHMKARWNPKGGHKPCLGENGLYCLCRPFSLCFFLLFCFNVVFFDFFCYFIVGPKLAKVGLAKVEIGQSRTKPWPKSELAKVGRAPWFFGVSSSWRVFYQPLRNLWKCGRRERLRGGGGGDWWFEKEQFLWSREAVVARLKVSGTDGRATPGVEPATWYDSTQETSPSRDIARTDRVIALSRFHESRCIVVLHWRSHLCCNSVSVCTEKKKMREREGERETIQSHLIAGEVPFLPSQ